MKPEFEEEKVEFKEKWRDEHMKLLSAFANQDGGNMNWYNRYLFNITDIFQTYIGYTDNKRVKKFYEFFGKVEGL